MSPRTGIRVCDDCRGRLECRLGLTDALRIAEEDGVSLDDVLSLTRCGIPVASPKNMGLATILATGSSLIGAPPGT